MEWSMDEPGVRSPREWGKLRAGDEIGSGRFTQPPAAAVAAPQSSICSAILRASST